MARSARTTLATSLAARAADLAFPDGVDQIHAALLGPFCLEHSNPANRPPTSRSQARRGYSHRELRRVAQAAKEPSRRDWHIGPVVVRGPKETTQGQDHGAARHPRVHLSSAGKSGLRSGESLARVSKDSGGFDHHRKTHRSGLRVLLLPPTAVCIYHLREMRRPCHGRREMVHSYLSSLPRRFSQR